MGKTGEVSEWLKEHAWKVCIRLPADRGFESLPLRDWLSVGREGLKGVLHRVGVQHRTSAEGLNKANQQVMVKRIWTVWVTVLRLEAHFYQYQLYIKR
jgi:hypothetical protein